MIFLLTPNSYHQDVEDWKFGKLSAVREIQLAIEGGYRYYYMGTFTNSKNGLKTISSYLRQGTTFIHVSRCVTRPLIALSMSWVSSLNAMQALRSTT